MEPPDRSDDSRRDRPAEDAQARSAEVDELWDSSEGEDAPYNTSPPCTPRQMKRMSGKHQRNASGRSAGRSPNKAEKAAPASQAASRERESTKPSEPPEAPSYRQDKKQRANLRSNERDHKKTFEGSFMLDPLSKSAPFGSLGMDPRKPYLSLGCGSAKLLVTMPHPLARTHRQTSRTDCPADRLKFFETLRLLLKLTSMSSKKKEREREQRGLENTGFLGQNNEVIWLELQAWHARRSVTDQDLYLFTARKAIPDIISEVLNFRVDFRSLSGAGPEAGDAGDAGRLLGMASFGECASGTVGVWAGEGEGEGGGAGADDPSTPLGGAPDCREHLQRQRLAFEQVKRVMELLESVEALYPSLQTLQKDYEKYAAPDFQARVQALCLWLNITQDLNQKLRIMGTVLGLRDLSRLGWPVFDIPSPRCSRGNEDDDEDEEEEENDSTATFTGGQRPRGGAGGTGGAGEGEARGRARASPCLPDAQAVPAAFGGRAPGGGRGGSQEVTAPRRGRAGEPLLPHLHLQALCGQGPETDGPAQTHSEAPQADGQVPAEVPRCAALPHPST
ncbi:hypothetical protein ANANG_G00303010 [Anguilla anguilla]|uniref:Mitogen-activated protein kinase kinase kinase N-terminal domain-containing protein n=1 Tax=Anguilla anguilla TaxID=7936 RepID=A0A9D3LRH8_ANGAN|nr:hypothetical protein ANANG_G00303010 [Anguilla anguilla]